MKYIVDFFTALGDVISAVVDFVIDLFKGLVNFFTSLPDYIEIIESYIDLVPAQAKVLFTMVLAMVLIFVIIGRRGT